MPHKRSEQAMQRRKIKSKFKKLHDCKVQWINTNARLNKTIDVETNEVDLIEGTTFETFILPDGTVLKQGYYSLEWDEVEKILIKRGIIPNPNGDRLWKELTL